MISFYFISFQMACFYFFLWYLYFRIEWCWCCIFSDLLNLFFTQLPSCICFSEKQYRKRASHDNIFVLQKMRDVILSPQSTLTTLQNTLNHIGHMHQVLTHLISTIQWKHTHTYQEKHKRFFIQDAKPFLLQSFSKHLVNAKWGLINTIILMNALLGRLVLLGKKYYCF